MPKHDPKCPKASAEKARCLCVLIESVRAEYLPRMSDAERNALAELRGTR